MREDGENRGIKEMKGCQGRAQVKREVGDGEEEREVRWGARLEARR